MRRKSRVRAKDRFGWAKFSHKRSAGCSRNSSWRNLPLCMLLSSTDLADTHTISYCSLLPLNNKKILKDRVLTQPEMLSNYAVQIKNKQDFPKLVLIINLSHYSCCPNTSKYYYTKTSVENYPTEFIPWRKKVNLISELNERCSVWTESSMQNPAVDSNVYTCSNSQQRNSAYMQVPERGDRASYFLPTTGNLLIH